MDRSKGVLGSTISFLVSQLHKGPPSNSEHTHILSHGVIGEGSFRALYSALPSHTPGSQSTCKEFSVFFKRESTSTHHNHSDANHSKQGLLLVAPNQFTITASLSRFFACDVKRQFFAGASLLRASSDDAPLQSTLYNHSRLVTVGQAARGTLEARKSALLSISPPHGKTFSLSQR